MSMSHKNVVNLPTEAERRKRGLFSRPEGRHKRTPETWAKMVADLAAAERKVEEMRGERDKALGKVEQLERTVLRTRQDVAQLGAELRQMRALMGSDAGNIAAPLPEDPSEVLTQPISQAELFAGDDPMRPLRPVIRVHDFTPPTVPSSDAVTHLLDRINPDDSEKVKHVDVTQPIPLWEMPGAEPWRTRRNTA